MHKNKQEYIFLNFATVFLLTSKPTGKSYIVPAPAFFSFVTLTAMRPSGVMTCGKRALAKYSADSLIAYTNAFARGVRRLWREWFKCAVFLFARLHSYSPHTTSAVHPKCRRALAWLAEYGLPKYHGPDEIVFSPIFVFVIFWFVPCPQASF